MNEIHKITVPKWGLSMQQAAVSGWIKSVGAPVKAGEELVEGGARIGRGRAARG